MKCLNCGCLSESYLCEKCRTPDVLDKIFNEIRFYNPETCENSFVIEFVSGVSEKYEERKILPQVLDYFDFNVTEYYYCLYYKTMRDERFESNALKYLDNHDINDIRTQRVLYDLLDFYIPNDFIKPKKWCDIIAENENLCCELYAVAAKFLSMIAEYDESDSMVEKAIRLCNDIENRRLLFSSLENMMNRLEKQKQDTLRYRTKKPYWPATEERRRAVAMFYDEKSISYPRIESRPPKTPENEFAPINECYDEKLNEYCAFWCSEAFSVSPVKSIYQIAAVKVNNSKIIDTFESFIRPWDSGAVSRKSAAKEAGVSLDVIEGAEDVDIVLPKFFEFVGESVLVSTAALGNQSKLLCRAARYAGMKGIKNEFFDLLDFAADTSEEFDLSNNSREYLLSHFSIDEGKSSLDKAKINKQFYDLLINYGE